MRLDKWLWAARFFKTRSLATDEIGRGRVEVNAQFAKAGRLVRVGDVISVRQAGGCPLPRIVMVRALSDVRGPAPVAQLLYEETEASRQAIAQWGANSRYTTDPAQSIEQGRPTKSDRRQLTEWQRWSVSLDDD
ncbi:MAG: RNA-binding S4 domain-containing protein, partial [Leptothrix sp. (in: b-proteobacteria)]